MTIPRLTKSSRLLSTFSCSTLFSIALLGACSTETEHEPGSWTLVWSDEFEGESIDQERWGFDVDCWGGGNDERQCYTDRSENAYLEDGMLVIAARRENWTGSNQPQQFDLGENPEEVTREFTSARLTTRGHAVWTYGRFEIRAQLPDGLGIWPAIWMLPEDNAYGGWAASGEIDIMEAINFGIPCEVCESGTEDRVHGTLHYGAQWPDNTHSGSWVSLNDTGKFHIYAIEWTPSSITWFVDDKKFARQTPDDWFTDGEFEGATVAAPFDQAFHIILNLAVGGEWPERQNPGVISYEGFPKFMRVDWVRVYQCTEDFDANGACPGANKSIEN